MGDDEPLPLPSSHDSISPRPLRRVPGSFDDGEISPTKDSFTPTAPPPAPLAESNLRSENIPPLQPTSASASVASAGAATATATAPEPADRSLLEMEGLSLLDDKHADSLTAQAVREHLQDIDSSFAPPISPLPTIVAHGADDTFVFDSPSKRPTTTSRAPPLLSSQSAAPLPSTLPNVASQREAPLSSTTNVQHPSLSSASPPLPSSSAPVPAATSLEAQEEDESLLPRMRSGPSDFADTSATTASLEAFSSSPTAAAAARTISRAISRASAGRSEGDPDTRPGYANDNTFSTEDQSGLDAAADDESQVALLPTTAATDLLTAAESVGMQHGSSDADLKRSSLLDAGSTPGHALRYGKRPKYLRSRNASQRSSVSSFATNTSSHDDGDSDATVGLGTDYALQSGGALPALGLPRGGGISSILSRSVSLGSIGSGFDDPDSSGLVTPAGHPLERLDEDDDIGRGTRALPTSVSDPLATPRAKGPFATGVPPTDTVIARRVMNVQVPESLAREYKSKGGLLTPRKVSEFSVGSSPRHGGGATTGTTGTGRNVMTLKEQSNTIERLSKENFDLKLKVMFLNDRLNKLSEEGVKEMISENVELKTSLAVLQRDNKVLRRRAKELEKQLKEEDERERPSTARSGGGASSMDFEEAAAAEQDAQEREEELVYLRERIEEYASEVEHLRNENMAKEAEKRRMADHVRSLQSAGEKHVGQTLDRQEEADVFKDLLEQETARREQADDDNRKLRDEIFRLKQEITSSLAGGVAAAGSGPAGHGAMHHTTNIYNITKKQQPRASSPSRAGSVFSGDLDAVASNGLASVASTLVEELRREGEQLRHENAELRREVGAQTSMLTSRNREKERLYQEIEDLKLAARRGGPAPSTVDSLLDRSASRAGGRERSASRASGGTRVALSTVEDDEREEMELRLGELRDRLNEVKLANQDLQTELAACQEDLEKTLDAKRDAEEAALIHQEDLEAAVADMMAIQAERDDLLQENEQVNTEFNNLQAEAQEMIDNVENELAAKTDEAVRVSLELAERTENFHALQDEMRKLSESLMGLEDEQANKMRKIQSLESQLGEANKELEDLEAKLLESNDKAQRLSVQQESGHAEIEFLREEQEGDKIRIGDLEASLANAERSLKDEKERVRELEGRLQTERRQREIVANREKEEVQQFVNELNRDMSAAKDEARKLRKSLSNREKEVVEWKERLHELENNLREALGDLNGTRSSLLKSIGKLQSQLEDTVRELNAAKASVMEKDHIIKQRDTLLETQSLDNRRLTELLEKERQQHRTTKSKYETVERTSQHVTHKVSSQDARIMELEQAKTAAARRIAQLEASFKEQLTERNNLLLLLWQRLSSLCGSDWAHDNSLINGRALPSMETVTTMLPGFSKNLLAAVKTIEKVVGGFHERVKDIERDLWREYRTLESSLEARHRTLDRLEAIVRSGVAAGTLGIGGPGQSLAEQREVANRMARLEDAYRQLKVENATLRTANDVRARAAAAAAAAAAASDANTLVDPHMLGGGSPSPSIPTGPRGVSRDRSRRGGTPSGGSSSRTATMTSSSHHHSSRPMTAGELALVDSHPNNNLVSADDQNSGSSPGQQAVQPAYDSKWILRLRELENKLKVEREGRLQDRSSAGQRIHELEAQTRSLARENDRRARAAASAAAAAGEENRGRQ